MFYGNQFIRSWVVDGRTEGRNDFNSRSANASRKRLVASISKIKWPSELKQRTLWWVDEFPFCYRKEHQKLGSQSESHSVRTHCELPTTWARRVQIPRWLVLSSRKRGCSHLQIGNAYLWGNSTGKQSLIQKLKRGTFRELHCLLPHCGSN